MAPNKMGNPLFCVKVEDKMSGRTIYVNFYATDGVDPPEVEITVEGLVRTEMLGPGPGVEDYKVPVGLSPMFWDKKKETVSEQDRAYVIEAGLNDRFVYRQVLTNLVIRHYAISVTLSVIMDKFNDPPKPNEHPQQYLGHKLDLDQPNYRVLNDKQRMERSNEIVNNKIAIVEPDREVTFDESKSDAKTCEDEPVSYELLLRPAMAIITCSISTDKLPKSIGFNDDQIEVVLDDKRVLSLHMPVSIDLTVPVKYKFDDRLCLFRMVCSIAETL